MSNNLQSKDLTPGGLYRHKNNRQVYRYLAHLSQWNKITTGQGLNKLKPREQIEVFEPIPLTADILTGWFGFVADDGEIAVGIGSEPNWFKYPTTVYDSADGMYIDGCDIERPQVHDLQRFHLANTGDLLEGGPENSDQINRENEKAPT